MKPDLSEEHIAKLNEEVQNQSDHLYAFLKRTFPDLPIEGRLQYLATILNDFFDDYIFDEKDEMKDEGYVIKKFFPRAPRSAIRS